MTDHESLLAYVSKLGTREQAAKRLGVSYQTLSSICNGRRGVGKKMAAQLEKATKGKLKANKLVWIGASK